MTRQTLPKIRKTEGTPPVEIATLSQLSSQQEAKFITHTNLASEEKIPQYLAIESSTNEISFSQPNLSLTTIQICIIQLATTIRLTKS
jgi:hypothetical protein